LKFRAPDVTVRIGLGIGRLVFRALNAVELVLAAVLLVTLVVDPSRAAWPLGVAMVVLAAQLIAVRPRLTRRSDAVLSGRDDVPRSPAHLVYIGLEVVKVLALLIGGVLLLSVG
jgi:hypothetical protein